jgi:hypothetical protein
MKLMKQVPHLNVLWGSCGCEGGCGGVDLEDGAARPKCGLMRKKLEVFFCFADMTSTSINLD